LVGPATVVKVELDCEIEDNPYTEMRVDFMVWNPSLDVIREAVEVAQALVNLPDVDNYPGIRFGCSLGIDGEELLDELLLDKFKDAEPVLQAQDLGTVLPNKAGDTMVLTEFYYRNE
jgi:hypothetical protein